MKLPARTLVAAISLLSLLPTSTRAQDSITVAAFGGQYQRQTSDAWFKPAAEKLGVKLFMDVVGTVADLRAHVRGGKTNWDVVLIAGSSCATSAKEELIQPLDYKVIDTTGIPANMVHPRYVAVLQYSTMLVWNKERYKGAEPESWADFWDVKKFPGTRALDARAVFSFEFALMADGVAPDKLYPLDVDRAMKKIDVLRPHIGAYYANGAVAVQLVKDGEAEMLPLFENRVYELIREGVPLGYTLNQAIVDINCLVVPNGSPKRDLAMKFIAEIVKPEINARIASTSDMSPTNTRIFELGLIPADRAKSLSSLPANMKGQATLNGEWWAPNMSDLTQRYKALISKN